MCQNSCNECIHKVYSSGVAVVTVDGTDTLVVSIPQQSFRNCERGCLVITQTIPTTATISMPVAIAIGDDTTIVYPLVDCSCNPVTACMVRSRRRYPFKVTTNLTSGTFKILKNLSCGVDLSIPSIPAT